MRASLVITMWVVLMCVPAAAALAQEPDAAAQVAELRGLLEAERTRVTQLEGELRQRTETIDHLVSRLDALAAAVGTPAAPTSPAVPAPAAQAAQVAREAEPPRFDFYADTLIRLATLHQEYGGCVGCPDRTVGRFRMRFGAEGRLAPGMRAVFGLSAGELNDPNSVYQTFGGNLGRKVATWDRAYVVYRPAPAKWLELQAGKFPYPWVRSSMTFDVDFYPEGASEKASFDLRRAGVLRSVSAQAMQVVINEQAVGPDMLLIGGQGSATLALGSRLTTRALVTSVDIRRPEFILRSQFDGTNVGVKNTNAIVGQGSTAQYASAFRYANLIVENAVRTPWPAFPVTASVEYQRNTRAASSRHTATSLRVDTGRGLHHGDWLLSWHAFRVEQDAIVSALGESDWRAPSNVVQHRFGITYTAQDHVQALFTWYRGRTLDTSLPGAVVVPGIQPGAREPWANRLYFDILYRF